MPTDRAVLFQGTLRELLLSVDRLMLYPRAVRQKLPSLVSASSMVDFADPYSLWSAAESSVLLATLSQEDSALQVTGVFDLNTANVYLHLALTEEAFGFLTTAQAGPLIKAWR